MSDSDPDRADSRGPQPPAERRRNVLLWAAVGLPAVCLVVGVALAVWWLTAGRDGTSGGGAAGSKRLGEYDSLEAKHAAVAAAMNSDSLGVGPDELASIEKLFDAIVAASANAHDIAFIPLVHADLFFEEMKRSGAMPAHDAVEESLLKVAVIQGLKAPGAWNRYKIAQVEHDSGGRTALVYARFWDAGGVEYPMRWWIVRDDDAGWMAYDWEALNCGVRGSREYAIVAAHAQSPAMRECFDARDALAAAGRLISDGEFEQAAELIRHIEQIDPPAPFRDGTWLAIGNTWTRCGRPIEAMACFRRVEQPEAAPGAILGQALCQQAWGRHGKALRLASRYEQMVGRGPLINGLRGRVLMDLGRTDEAIAEFRKSLDILPDQIGVLRSLGLALPPQQKTILSGYVTRTSDPAESAVLLAETFAYHGDLAGLEAMAAVLGKTAPDPADTAYLAAMILLVDGDYAGAAGLFGEAYAEDPDVDRRQWYNQCYCQSVILSGDIVGGYAHAPDRSAALEILGDAYLSGEYDFPRSAILALLQAHRGNQPEDPRLCYYTGLLLEEQEEYDMAARQYAAGMANARDEAQQKALRELRVLALFAAGKGMEAYREITPQSETFFTLAGQYLWPEQLGPEKTAELGALVETHRQVVPDDPWLDYFAGVVAQNEGNLPEADRHFASGYRRADEEEIKSAYRERWLDLRFAAGEILPALEDIEPANETFLQLAWRLGAARQGAQLESLVEAYRRLDPNSPALRFWEVEVLWSKKDYEGVVRRLAPWSVEKVRQYGEEDAAELGEKLVRSYLRLGCTAEATAAAETMYYQGQSLPLILASATARDVEKTTELVEELLPARELAANVYFDEDVGRIVRAAGFQPFRRACPPGLRYDLSSESVVLLLKKPRKSNAGQVRASVTAVLGGSVTTAGVPAPSRADAPISYAADASGQVYCVTYGTDRYEPDEPDYRETIGPALGQAVEEHHAWLAIDVSALNDARRQTRLAAACLLAAELFANDCVAVYFRDRGRLLGGDATTPDVLRSIRSLDDLEQSGEQVWMVRDTSDDQAEQERVRQRRRELYQFCSGLAGPEPPEGLYVTIRLRLGPASEPASLQVRQIIGPHSGSPGFVGEFTGDSLLVPGFQLGEPIRVELYEVEDWQFAGR